MKTEELMDIERALCLLHQGYHEDAMILIHGTYWHFLVQYDINLIPLFKREQVEKILSVIDYLWSKLK